MSQVKKLHSGSNIIPDLIALILLRSRIQILSGFSVHPVSQESTADGKLELSAKNLLPSSLVGGRNGTDYHNDHSSKRESDFDSHKPNQLELLQVLS